MKNIIAKTLVIAIATLALCMPVSAALFFVLGKVTVAVPAADK